MTDRELLELIAKKVAAIEIISEKVASLETNFSNMKSDVNNLKSDFNEMKSNMNEMKSDMDEMKSNMNEIKSDMDDMKSNINILKQKQDIIMEQTAGLSEFGASASAVLSHHNDSIEFLKARQTALEEEVFRLKKKIS